MCFTTARRYASAVYAVLEWLSVCHKSEIIKTAERRIMQRCRTIAQGL